ncbi:MAG: RluA family pseudouridine synthase [Eubacteriales bacterium]|nr:RluA family pseudouridine synthase [Eubacteriales bacterium]
MKSFVINKNDAGRRADQFVSRVCKNMPKSLIQKSFRKGRIKVNGKKIAYDYRLAVGDEAQLYINDEFFGEVSQEVAVQKVKPQLDIIYEDENIIIVDKPAGMIVHSDEGESVNTLINHIISYLIGKGEYDPNGGADTFVPALCHRIDRNTCGLVVAAKNAESLRVMNDIIKHRMIRKIYRCCLVGVPQQKKAVCEAYLKRDLDKKRVYVTKEKQKDALPIKTGYHIISSKDGLSLAEVELFTGRTHQIRAHMAFLGYPLAGDGKYGTNAVNKSLGLSHQELCAYMIQFKDGFEQTALGYLCGKCFISKKELVTFKQTNLKGV